METNIAISICRYLEVDERYAKPPWIFADASETSGVIANWTGRDLSAETFGIAD